jgi:hypothetical protein
MSPTDPPEVFSLPTVLCPSCGHGIDVHTGWRDACGVGVGAEVLCSCLWTPNDIAAQRLTDLREQVLAMRKAVVDGRVPDDWDADGQVEAYDAVLDILNGSSGW